MDEVTRESTPSTSEARDGHRPSRRAFLKGIAVAGAAAAAAAVAPGEALAKRHGQRRAFLFRLSTRNTSHCRACSQHHRFRVYKSYVLANGNRAHPGCNCPIVRQRIALGRFRKLFGQKRGLAPGGILDLRTLPRRRA
jgi:hypothetical protein